MDQTRPYLYTQKPSGRRWDWPWPQLSPSERICAQSCLLCLWASDLSSSGPTTIPEARWGRPRVKWPQTSPWCCLWLITEHRSSNADCTVDPFCPSHIHAQGETCSEQSHLQLTVTESSIFCAESQPLSQVQ